MMRLANWRNTVRWSVPYLFVFPQLIITIVFFLLPALSALILSLQSGDAFGIQSHWVWLSHFKQILHDDAYMQSLYVSCKFALYVSAASMSFALFAAVLASRVVKGCSLYRTLLIWPYAVAPAVAGILWRFLFNPAIGVFSQLASVFGIQLDYHINSHQALVLLVVASAWQQFSYNFIFFLAGLQSIPECYLESAALDGASPFKQFWTIIFPLLSPVTFFLLIMNLLYSFFDTFGLVQTVTRGGPGDATTILVYKVYNDGFLGLNIGGSCAQSVMLMLFIIFLTVIQFTVVERKVHYQ